MSERETFEEAFGCVFKKFPRAGREEGEVRAEVRIGSTEDMQGDISASVLRRTRGEGTRRSEH